MNEIDFTKLSNEEKEILEKECLKHLYIMKFFEENGVDLALLSKEIVCSIRCQANIQLRLNEKQKQEKMNEEKVDVIVRDGEETTYKHRNKLKALGLKFNKETKDWRGKITKEQIKDLENCFLYVEVMK